MYSFLLPFGSFIGSTYLATTRVLVIVELSTPFWEFRQSYRQRSAPRPSRLSTPFWEFRTTSRAIGSTYLATTTFYSLLGVSHENQRIQPNSWHSLFLLPFGSFAVVFFLFTLLHISCAAFYSLLGVSGTCLLQTMTLTPYILSFLLPFGSF